MKTAVEQLEDILNKRLNHLVDNRVHIKEFVRTAKSAEVRKILECLNKIKQMEKQQIIDAYETSHISMMSAEQYYNETFKSDEQE